MWASHHSWQRRINRLTASCRYGEWARLCDVSMFREPSVGSSLSHFAGLRTGPQHRHLTNVDNGRSLGRDIADGARLSDLPRASIVAFSQWAAEWPMHGAVPWRASDGDPSAAIAAASPRTLPAYDHNALTVGARVFAADDADGPEGGNQFGVDTGRPVASSLKQAWSCFAKQHLGAT